MDLCICFHQLLHEGSVMIVGVFISLIKGENPFRHLLLLFLGVLAGVILVNYKNLMLFLTPWQPQFLASCLPCSCLLCLPQPFKFSPSKTREWDGSLHVGLCFSLAALCQLPVTVFERWRGFKNLRIHMISQKVLASCSYFTHTHTVSVSITYLSSLNNIYFAGNPKPSGNNWI